jgi:hypothetical protein
MAIEYMHDLPGRLRVRSPLFRKNSESATAVKNSLESADGVRSVTVNLLTGSVTIQYDGARTTTTATLLDILKAHGCSISLVTPPERFVSGDRIPIAIVRGRGLPPHGPAVGRAVAGFIIEKAIERSLMAVVTAVL